MCEHLGKLSVHKQPYSLLSGVSVSLGELSTGDRQVLYGSQCLKCLSSDLFQKSSKELVLMS